MTTDTRPQRPEPHPQRPEPAEGLPTAIGTITFAPLHLDRDAELLHAWVTHPRSRFWGMQDADPATVRDAYAAIAADPHHHAWLGSVDGVPAFLAETYDPAQHELARHYPVRDGDLGMHVLVAPGPRVAGFTSAVFTAVMTFCFADASVRRVVVEPDVGNRPVAAKNAAAGFVVDRLVRLPEKTAALSFCTRDAFRTSPLGPEPASRPDDSAAHLEPAVAARAHRHLVTKALAEFSHERLLAPRRLADDRWAVDVDGGRVRYTFAAVRHPLEHWVLEAASVSRTVDGEPRELDVLELVLELAPVLSIPDDLVGTYLEEVSSTLASLAYKWTHAGATAEDLLGAGFQQIEAAMTEGHPAFLANNGRIGFGRRAHDAWSPEAGRPQRLLWLGVRRTLSHFAAARGVTEEQHYRDEVGPDTLAALDARLRQLGLDPADYRLLPVHPWQWDTRIAITFAADVARRDLVHLGETEDRYQAQQSIRTFFDVDRPDRSYVKTALAVQNMGFLRGLSARYMRATPAINDFVADLVTGDPTLRDVGFSVLREHATTGYTGSVYARLPAGSPYQKMLAALWRESPVPGLAAGERLATMASLLHRDAAGRSFLAALVRASGLTAAEWVRRYLRVYLRPVAHCLVAHDLAFMPHGENLIMVLTDHVPTRTIMKDIGEEVAVLSADRPLPPEVERVRAVVDDEVKALSVQTDVFDGVLRFVAAVLDVDGLLDVHRFWELVADCLDELEADHPELAGRLDLRAPRFAHSCLNRLQLRDTRQMVDLTDQAGSLIISGTLANPVARTAVPA